MEFKTIKQFNIGEEVLFKAKLESSDLIKINSGKKFLKAVFSDLSGSIDFVSFDNPETYYNNLKVGSAYKISGITVDYKGMTQIKVGSYMELPETELSQFVKTAALSVEVMVYNIEKCIDSIKNNTLRELTSLMWTQNRKSLLLAPAAKSLHHNYQSGLLYHIFGMLASSEALCGSKPGLNKDLLQAGIILHDIKKPEEFEMVNGTVKDYTLEGNLIGHISLAFAELTLVAEKIGKRDTREYLMLSHLILSHHGQLDWGSPVTPKIPEAYALHHLDNLDAKVESVLDFVSHLEYNKSEIKKGLGILYNSSL